MGGCVNSNQNAHNIDVACEWPPGQFNCVPAASPPAGDNDDALLPPADDDAAQEEPLLAARQGQVRAILTLYDDSKKNPSRLPFCVQRSAKVDATSSVNFISAVAYRFCLTWPAAFTQPGASTFDDLCTSGK